MKKAVLPRNLEHAQLIARDKFLAQLRAEMRGVRNTPEHFDVNMFKRLENWIKRISKEIDP